MVNRIRTLLMNTGRNGYGVNSPGEQYTPEDYKPKKLPPAMFRWWNVVVNPDNDREAINNRMLFLMRVIHTSRFSDDALAEDSRVTYLPLEDGGDGSVWYTLRVAESILGADGLIEVFGDSPEGQYAKWSRIYNNEAMPTIERMACLLLAFATRVGDL